MVMMDVMMMMMAVIIALTIWLPAQEPVATIIAQRKDAHELIQWKATIPGSRKTSNSTIGKSLRPKFMTPSQFTETEDRNYDITQPPDTLLKEALQRERETDLQHDS